MAYDFKRYQEREAQSGYLRFSEYKETEYMLRFRQEEIARFEEYIRVCSEYRNNRINTDRHYRQILNDKKQIHEKEEMKRSICMKI